MIACFGVEKEGRVAVVNQMLMSKKVQSLPCLFCGKLGWLDRSRFNGIHAC
ncbi:hypothetical protein Fmac_013600 [Flemingia macrophylla]|uniref:Uncharacterized protein n=1 Tax=Flemingia macrophylla TaxID=520843 RepID=A0ABD1MTK6_9FABA